MMKKGVRMKKGEMKKGVRYHLQGRTAYRKIVQTAHNSGLPTSIMRH